jgi:hypothetical protein
MFRDQSGLAATIGLTQVALQATQQGAATTGSQASQNLQAQLQATTERQKTAANMITDLAKTAAAVYTGGLSGLGGGGSSGGSGGQSSKKGEMINYFDKTQGSLPEQRTGGSSESAGSVPGISGGSPGSVPRPSNGPSSSGQVTKAPSSPSSFSQNPAARAAVGGDQGLLASLISKVSSVMGMGDGGSVQVLSQLRVAPDYDLRSADYAAIQADKGPSMPQQADWMLMCSIRDSENWFIDYEGTDEENVAAFTTVKEVSKWFRMTGWYKTEYNNAPTLAELKATNADGSNAWLLLGIKGRMIAGDYPFVTGVDTGHLIVLRSKITVDETTGIVKFNYWTWGTPERNTEIRIDTLMENVLSSAVVTKI